MALTVGVVGCGRWGINIVRDLVSLGCRVVGVDPSRTARIAARRGGASAVEPDLAACDRNHRVDGVVVAGPTRLHAAHAKYVLDRGVPVFVEKPLTDDVRAARELVDAANGRLFVMHKWFYHPGIEGLARLNGSGHIGEIRGVTSERFGPAQPSVDMDPIWLLAPHEITIGARIHGSFAVGHRATADRTATGQVTGIDATSSWENDRWHTWTISTRPGPLRRTVVVHGTRGDATLDGAFTDHISVRLHASAARTAPMILPVSAEMPLLRELQVFVDHLRGGPPPETSGEHGLAVVEAIVGVRESAGLPVASVLSADC